MLSESACHEDGEHHRHDHRMVVFGLGEQRLVVLKPDELGRQAERILPQEGLPHRLCAGQ